MVFIVTLLVLYSSVLGSQAWGQADCAFSVWSEWTTHNSGAFQQRTREILRQEREGGRPCVGPRVQYRTSASQPDPGVEALLSLFLTGNAQSYSLGGGQFYTLSRDLVILLDTTIQAELLPYTKAMVSNLIGKVCGDFGAGGGDNRVTLATFDTSGRVVHRFGDLQAREVIQDKALKVPRSADSWNANIIPAADLARTTLLSENSGARRYNNATKEVLIVTSFTDNCSLGLTRALNRLRTTAEVFIIVIGHGGNQPRPHEWCLEKSASAPSQSHFRQLEDITAISQVSITLLQESPENNFCVQPTAGN